MKELREQIQQLVSEELDRANGKFGGKGKEDERIYFRTNRKNDFCRVDNRRCRIDGVDVFNCGEFT